MSANGLPRILICAEPSAALAELRPHLSAIGSLSAQPLGEAEPKGPSDYQLIVIDAQHHPASALEGCRRLRERLNGHFVPILFLGGEGGSPTRWAGLHAGADVCLARPFAGEELLAQVQALLRIKGEHDRLAGRTAEVHRINQRLHELHQQLDHELQLAQRIQSSFLPQSLPTVPHLRFAVHYLPRGRVGGDFYDVFRLDERHVGLYVADAMGHGVPASLLTVFVKKGVRAKEVFGEHYRLVPPEEVLARLNKDLIEQQLAEHPFITMAYALYNHEDGVFRFARAGHPYPLYVPREGEPTFWRQEGLLLGVVDATYPAREYPLKSGDKVLLYSDGIDTAHFADHRPGAASLLACARQHRQLPIHEFLAQLARGLFDGSAQPDDLTMLGMEVLSDIDSH